MVKVAEHLLHLTSFIISFLFCLLSSFKALSRSYSLIFSKEELINSVLWQNSHFRDCSIGLKRRGAPQFLQVKLIDLNFKVVYSLLYFW